MVASDQFSEVYHATYDGRAGSKLNGYQSLTVSAGNRGFDRVVPPAGEEYAFYKAKWARRVDISVSPTGRSVRIFVDGNEICAPPTTGGEEKTDTTRTDSAMSDSVPTPSEGSEMSFQTLVDSAISGVRRFADEMREQKIHVGMRSQSLSGPGVFCVTCGNVWPCEASRA